MRLIEVAARSELLFQAASSAFGRLRYSKPSGDELILQIMEQIGDSGPIRPGRGRRAAITARVVGPGSPGASGAVMVTSIVRSSMCIDTALLTLDRSCHMLVEAVLSRGGLPRSAGEVVW